MKKNYIFKIFLILLYVSPIYSTPKSSFQETYTIAEMYPVIEYNAKKLAEKSGQPVIIYLKEKILIEAKGIENGKVVYTVITNFFHPEINGSTLFFDEVSSKFNLNKARLVYFNGRVIDNTGEKYELKISHKPLAGEMLLVLDSQGKRVIGLDPQTGDIVDTAFIPPQDTLFGTAKDVKQTPWCKIAISDQLKYVVYEFDTSGTFIRILAPAGGQNVNIMSNIRGIAFRPNTNLLVTVGAGGFQNSIIAFNQNGDTLGQFITASGLNSPFAILYYNNSVLVSNSSGNVRVSGFDTTGNNFFLFTTSNNLNFPQQMSPLSNGNLAVAGFSAPSGVCIFSPAGTYVKTLTGVSYNRGVWQLGNGHIITTNTTGLYELNDSSGAVIRTIISGSGYFSGQFISYYNPNLINAIHHESNTSPEEFQLYQNYPNPFNPVTKIKFRIPNSSVIVRSGATWQSPDVTLKVYDITGKEIAIVVNEQLKPGTYEVTFDASNLPSGIYFYQLQAGEFSQTKKMLMIK
jgi:hypothetical protein